MTSKQLGPEAGRSLVWTILGWTATMAVLVLIAGPWILVFVAVPLSHYLLWGRALSREAAADRRLVQLAEEFDEAIENIALTVELDRSPGDERIREPRQHIVAPARRGAGPHRT